jgi:hypothetical protein
LKGDWVQNLPPSYVLSYNVKIKIYNTIVLPVILYGIFENRALELDLERRKEQEVGENYIMRSFIICSLHVVLVVIK